MQNFWDYNVWGTFLLFAVLLCSLLVGNILKKSIPLLRDSLIPTSVLGGVLLVIVAAVYKWITGDVMFDTAFFGGDGTTKLEIITYHSLALGFIASTLKNTKSQMNKQRAEEIFNTGVTTVATYLLQAVVGFGITLVLAMFITDFFPAAGVLLPFGYGQGSGQALNYGNIYENDFGFVGGKSFGLTLAALGFLSASIGGVIHLNILKRRGTLKLSSLRTSQAQNDAVEGENEIPLSESMDKMSVQIALIALTYFIAYGLMVLLGMLIPGMKSVIYGFNFLLGVIGAMLVKLVMNFCKKKSVIKKEYINNFLMTRAGNFCFDIMIVAGIAAIRLDIVEKYWGVLILLGVVGAIITYVYERVIAKKLFLAYYEEQFLVMYGMLTGTASTGIILLREVDSEFETPASDNMVYQNLPAIVFGFPIMLLATLAPQKPLLTFGILIAFFIVMNIILFRRQLFHKKKK